MRLFISGKSEASEASEILNIYQNLKNNFEKSGHPDFFENAHLESLARCKNDLLREKLIEESIKEEWASEDIRTQAKRLNDFNKYLEKNYNNSTKEDIVRKAFVERTPSKSLSRTFLFVFFGWHLLDLL